MLPGQDNPGNTTRAVSYDVPCPKASDFAFDTSGVELLPAVEIYSSGANVALNRWPNVECQRVDAGLAVWTVPSWKPGWPKVHTVGLAFPEAIEFLPPEKPEDNEKLETIRPKKKKTTSDSEDDDTVRKPTRLKPPSDALSLEDRLFYILQPPLETMLAGQELIMPLAYLPYQRAAIAFGMGRKSALFADEMGLGKTMQTITAVRLLLRSGHVRKVLFVCPKPLIPNWQREFKAWAEELPIVTVEGDTARRKLIWTMPGVPILMTNYELLTRDIDAMPEDERPKFDLVVLDEAQRIKNRDSKTAEVARGLNRKRSWALTGTPIENRPEELVGIFDFVSPGHIRSEMSPRRMGKAAVDYILRRTKDMVLTDLPPKMFRDAEISLTPEQWAAYRIAEDEGVVRLTDLGDELTIQHVFQLVLRLKQICTFDPVSGASSKMERLAADLDEVAASGQKAIVFSQWVGSLKVIRERLPNLGVLEYHGKVPMKQREKVIDQFKNDPNASVILMSYGAGSVGLNLQFCRYVYLFDRWWNPAVEDQAINRAHRIGQTRPVSVHMPMAIHPAYRDQSFDCLLQSLMQRKRRLASTALWPMGDTGTDAADLQKMFATGEASDDGNALVDAIEKMFARDGLRAPDFNADGSVELPEMR